MAAAAALGKALAQSALRAAPMDGLTLNKPLTGMPKAGAIILSNWIVRREGVTLRDGYVIAGTGLGPVSMLMRLNGSLFAASSTAINPVSGVGPRMTGLAPAYSWGSALQTNDAGQQFLIAASGASPPVYSNGTGSSWTTTSIAAVSTDAFSDGSNPTNFVTLSSPANLMGPVNYHGYVVFYERGTLNIWHLNKGAISGQAFPIWAGTKSQRGGEIVCLGVNGPGDGTSATDQLLAVTSRGELIVYEGNNPNNFDTFKWSGTYNVPPPVGRSCLGQYGDNLYYLSTDGLMQVMEVAVKTASGKRDSAISENIGPALRQAIAAAPADPAWSVVDSRAQAALIINAPASAQWAMGGETKAWSTFAGLAATCWLDCEAGLFFGRADGTVCQMMGNSDNNAAINGLIIPAFERHGKRIYHRCRPVFLGAQPYVPQILMLTDFQPPPGMLVADTIDSALWTWPQVYGGPLVGQPWTRGLSNRAPQWRSLNGYARTASTPMIAIAATSPVVFNDILLAYEGGAE